MLRGAVGLAKPLTIPSPPPAALGQVSSAPLHTAKVSWRYAATEQSLARQTTEVETKETQKQFEEFRCEDKTLEIVVDFR